MIRRLPEFQSYNKRATRKVTAYVMPDLQARSGNEWVDAGDNVTVLREEGNAYLVRYPVSNGTKTRWVNKNEIFSGSTPNSGNVNVNHNPQGNVQVAESTQPNTLHVKGTAFDQDNPNGSIRLHVYVGGTPGSNVPQYEIRTNGSNRVFDDTRKIDSNYSGNQLVHIYALNDYGSGDNVEIWKGYVNIQGNNPTSSGYIWPIKNPANPDNYTINTLYYYSNDSLGKEHSSWFSHYNALDIKAAMKTEIVAVADGEVIASGPSAITKTKKAKYVKIQHANNTVSLYAHLSNNDIVKIGQKVSAGQVIGLSGDTGTPGSPHLHFEFSNVNAFKYYRDKYPLHYRVWIKNAYYKRKDSISEGDRREFEEAINWISSHGDRSFIN